MALLVGSLGCGTAAVAREAALPEPADAVRPVPLGTPVLSVRRLPGVVAAPVAERRLRADLEAWAAGAPGGSCAVVRDESGQVLLDLHGEVTMRPASTQKLLTATAVLLQLGPGARFRTTLVGPAPVDGIVEGDLTLVGGGDPLLATTDYAARFEHQPQIFTDLDGLAASVAAAGITRISGAVVGDESRYDRVRYVDGWPARYLNQHVVGPLSGLSVNDGFAAYPSADASRPLVPAEDPAAQAAAVLTVLLEARGIEVAGPPRAGTAPPDASELGAVESVPVSRIVAQMVQESDNSTAELLAKELGRAAGEPTTAGGRSQIAALLAGAGLDLSGTTVVDGSGLSLDDGVTCALLVDLLERPGTGPILQEGLAVAGTSGTLTDRFVGTPLVGDLRAKTGSLETVAALAGVVEDGDDPLTFAYVVNVAAPDRVDEPAVVATQQQLAEILLGWPRTPDVAVLGPLPAGEGG